MKTPSFGGRLFVLITLLSLVLGGCQTPKSDKPASQTNQATAPSKSTAESTAKSTTTTGSDGLTYTSASYPTGDPGTSAIGVRKGVPSQVSLNQPFEYVLAVENLSDLPLENVVISDQLDANFKLASSEPRATKSGALTQWDLGSLAPGEAKSIRVTGSATKEGNISSCASVSYDTSLCSTIAVVSPKLGLTKTGPAEVLRCEPIVYKFTVANAGSGPVTNVKIRDELPAGLKTKDGKSTIEMNVGTLAAGQSRTLEATVQASKTGRFVNKATATGSGLKASSQNVTTVVKEPVLTITKTGPKNTFFGRTSKYDITIKNTGDGVARDTVIEDAVPNGMKFVSATDGGQLAGNKVRWNAGALQPGATKTVSISLNATTAGVFRNRATAQANCAETVSATAETAYKGIPAILLEVVDLDDPVLVGSNETYVLTATNQGTAPGTNIAIICDLEEGMEFVSAGGATSGTLVGNRVTFAKLPSLAAKEKAVWRVVVKATKVGSVRFRAAMRSDQLTRPVDETEATNFYE